MLQDEVILDLVNEVAIEVNNDRSKTVTLNLHPIIEVPVLLSIDKIVEVDLESMTSEDATAHRFDKIYRVFLLGKMFGAIRQPSVNHLLESTPTSIPPQLTVYEI